MWERGLKQNQAVTVLECQGVAPRVGAWIETHRPCGLSRQQQRVSIHAPTRGATPKKFFTNSEEMFQSTLPHGERQGEDRCVVAIEVFQPTLPHGERHARSKSPPRQTCFNPRSHMGSDPYSQAWHQRMGSFNPRSHMGSDCIRASGASSARCFNPRSHMGSDAS